MENDKLFTTPTSLSYQLFDTQTPPELTSTPPNYLNLNWDHSMPDQPHFDSTLSSAISSPSSAAPVTESVVIRELIGRLGSICNSGEISPTSQYHSANTSCYNTPLNSPPKLNLSMMDPHHVHQQRQPISDQGFAERAARFSALGGGRNFPQFGIPEGGKLSRVSSSNEIPMRDGIQFHMENGELGSQFEDPSPSDRIKTGREAGVRGGSESNGRKRKAAGPKGKGKQAVNPPKVVEEDDSDQKRSRPSSGDEGGKENGDKKQGNESNGKQQEPMKDYIHVRARRGQATDSHSLAERVRREKISERMKFLQDLVPGCNKVTGKAVMLDEIINYVQSLQRQVEFLSMKLATVNPRSDINLDNFIPKEINQPHGPMGSHSAYPLESSSTGFSYIHHPHGNPLQNVMTNRLHSQYSSNHLDAGLRPNMSMQMAQLDGYVDATSQLGTFWEDDLHTVVQMGFGQNQDVVFSSPQNLQGSLSSAHMKVEL